MYVGDLLVVNDPACLAQTSPGIVAGPLRVLQRTPQQVAGQLGIRATPSRPHHLTDQKPQRTVVTFLKPDDSSLVLNDDAPDKLTQLAFVPDLRESFRADDLLGLPPGIVHPLEDVLGRTPVDDPAVDQANQPAERGGGDSDRLPAVPPRLEPAPRWPLGASD